MMLRTESKIVPFRGNGPYCYSNTASMLLSTIGEQIPPQEMEAYTGVGLGAFWLPKGKLLFFSGLSNPPDVGLTRALRVLGFSFDEKATSDPAKPPFDQLRSDLAKSAALLGPLDMGYLTHNPLHKRMMGADHFLLAFRFEDDGVLVHDPEGFPSVVLPFKQLELAWRADKIPYHRGHYRYWTNPRRTQRPGQEELYDSTLRSFKDIYRESKDLAAKQNWTIDGDAMMALANHVRKGKVSPGERGFMVFFSFKLGARRALDFAGFFGQREPRLAGLKEKQAELFGAMQVAGVQRKWARVADSLEQQAKVEEEFRDALMSI